MTINNREERRALERATRATRAAGDPAVAAELDQLRRTRQGAYALMHALVGRMGGTEDQPIEIPRGEWQTIPPLETLKVKIDPATNDARLYIERKALPE